MAAMKQRDPTDLRGLAQDAESQEQEERERARLFREDFQWLVKDARGRRILWRLMEESGVFRTSFNTNALLMAKAEGNRDYGLRVLGWIMTEAPDRFEQMLKEHKRNDD